MHTPKKKSLILTCAGINSRFSKRQSKTRLHINKKPLFLFSLEKFINTILLDEIIITTNTANKSLLSDDLKKHMPNHASKIKIILGGDTRFNSVKKGVLALKSSDTVIIHDGARPLVSSDLINRLVDAGISHRAVTPGIPVVDTLKYCPKTYIQKTISRDHLWAIQTPQLFQKEDLLNAYKIPFLDEITDETMLMEVLKVPVFCIAGDPVNVKLTYPQDLDFIRYYLSR